MTTLTPPAEADLPEIARLAAQAFGVEREAARRWVDLGGPANWRIPAGAGGVPCCCLLIPMGQFLGGSAVSAEGIAGVAVAPEARGRGLARGLMDACVRDLHARRVPISLLFSAMHPLYRRVGYETAGVVCKARLAAGDIEATDRGTGWRPFEADPDLTAVRSCYDAFAAAHHGYLARGPYIWERVQRPRGHQHDGFVALDDEGRVEAYLFARMGDHDPDRPVTGTMIGHTLSVSDMAWSSPRGLRRLTGFLRGYCSVVGEITFHGPPDSPLLLALPDRRFRVRVRDHWMLRVTSLPEAITQRGWPLGLRASLEINLADDTLPAHTGRWRITLDGSGEASCEPGGNGALTLDARALAVLYTGHMTATQLAMAGLVTGDVKTLRTADAVFGGFGQPSMADMF